MVRVLCHSPVAVSCCGQGDKGHCMEPEEIDRAKAVNAVQAIPQEEFNMNSDSNFSGFNSESGSCSDSDDRLTIDDADIMDSQRKERADKRKARRRERNKVCAQAYRQRKRQRSCNQQQTLELLSKENQELLEKIKDLEEQKSIIEGLILKKVKVPWHWHYYPTSHHYPTPTEMVTMPTCTPMKTMAVGTPMPLAADVSVAS